MKIPYELCENRQAHKVIMDIVESSLLERKTLHRADRIRLRLLKESKRIAEELLPSIRKYCVLDENLNPKVSEEGQLVFKDTADEEVFIKETQHLFEGEFEENVLPLPKDELLGAGFSEADLASIAPLLEVQPSNGKT